MRHSPNNRRAYSLAPRLQSCYNSSMKKQPLYTVTEAARKLKISGALIRRWIGQGRIRAQKIGPIWVITAADCHKPQFARPGPKAGK